MIITKKALPRRTFLRGVGASLALPLLDAMVPAMTAQAKRRPPPAFAASATSTCRWAATSIALDAARRRRPRRTLADPESLAPREATTSPCSPTWSCSNAYPGTHATSNAAFLSAARAKWTESTDYYLGTTADQIAAQQIGQETQLPSLELSMDLMQMVGQCDNGYACVYQNNLSWSSPTTPLPSEAHPRIVFERLFGEGGSAEERRAALRKRASLVDWVREDIARLQREVGVEDRRRVDQYLTTVREVERRIQKAEAERRRQPAARPRPPGRRARRPTPTTPG